MDLYKNTGFLRTQGCDICTGRRRWLAVCDFNDDRSERGDSPRPTGMTRLLLNGRAFHDFDAHLTWGSTFGRTAWQGKKPRSGTA
jgi:hypothetical protein